MQLITGLMQIMCLRVLIGFLPYGAPQRLRPEGAGFQSPPVPSRQALGLLWGEGAGSSRSGLSASFHLGILCLPQMSAPCPCSNSVRLVMGVREVGEPKFSSRPPGSLKRPTFGSLMQDRGLLAHCLTLVGQAPSSSSADGENVADPTGARSSDDTKMGKTWHSRS